MIKADGHIFVLETAHTTYCFRRMETGHLEHLYYGRHLTLPEHPAECDVAPLVEKHTFAPGNTNLCEKDQPFSLEDIRLEMSSYGKGDIREPFVEIVHADGSTTSDFHYESYEITEKTAETENGDLPGAYDERGEAQRLCIRLRDHSYDLVLELHYDVYAECDVIVRSAVLFNESGETVRLNRLMSTQIDFDPAEYVFTTFTGAWAREMHRSDTRMEAGKHVNASYTGTSSSRANPFVMIAKTDTTEDTGECYGCNLIYSGNHYEAAEVSGYGKMRLTAGINPQSFSWLLAPGENFAAPEAVMAYSCEGYNGMSQCMHAFVREHIVRGAFKHKVRPVLLNSWEAAYFDINERKLLALAKKAKEAGVELFVMDDGWFGERNDDAHSLGDWEVNEKKLPGGLAGLGRKIKALGLDFGIWVEPEMVNVNSHLYQAHPDWTIEIPGKPHAEGRNQRILDLTRTEVQDYIIETMTKVFSSAEIQTGYSYGYPMSVVSAHVSACPNHQTLRVTPLETRFAVAAFGICGYECNFCDLSSEDFAAVKVQIALYKQWREVLQKGRFYRGRTFGEGSHESALSQSVGNQMEWTCVSEDQTRAVGMLMQKLVVPNTQYHSYHAKGLKPDARYHFYNRSLKYNIKDFGDLVNTVSPVHIRQDSLALDLIARFKKMDGEIEDCHAAGDMLMYHGVKLKQAFGGTGYNNEVRYFQDFAARMYFMEEEKGHADSGEAEK